MNSITDQVVKKALEPYLDHPSLELEPASDTCWLAGIILGQRVRLNTARKWRAYMYQRLTRQFTSQQLYEAKEDLIRVWGWKTWDKVWRAVHHGFGIGPWNQDALRLLKAQQDSITTAPCWELLRYDKWIQRNLAKIDSEETQWLQRAQEHWKDDANLVIFMLWRIKLQ